MLYIVLKKNCIKLKFLLTLPMLEPSLLCAVEEDIVCAGLTNNKVVHKYCLRQIFSKTSVWRRYNYKSRLLVVILLLALICIQFIPSNSRPMSGVRRF